MTDNNMQTRDVPGAQVRRQSRRMDVVRLIRTSGLPATQRAVVLEYVNTAHVARHPRGTRRRPLSANVRPARCRTCRDLRETMRRPRDGVRTPGPKEMTTFRRTLSRRRTRGRPTTRRRLPFAIGRRGPLWQGSRRRVHGRIVRPGRVHGFANPTVQRAAIALARQQKFSHRPCRRVGRPARRAMGRVRPSYVAGCRQVAGQHAADGFLTGMSVGFSPVRSTWRYAVDWNPDLGADHMDHVVRHEARLHEVSLTPTPAYGVARVHVVDAESLSD